MAKKTPPLPPRSSSPSGADSFTNLKRVKELIALMADNGLTEIELVEDKSRIVLRRGTHTGGGSTAISPPVMHHTAPSHHAPAAPSAAPASTPEETLIPIKSPMVGTFYSAPNPETDAYVTIGKQVDEKSVVCIIEAMKVFNEIHAEVQGTIAKILVSNGQTVEYGQPLFLVKPE